MDLNGLTSAAGSFVKLGFTYYKVLSVWRVDFYCTTLNTCGTVSTEFRVLPLNWFM